MKCKISSMIVIALVLFFGNAIHAGANLIDLGGGLIYDSDQDLTWLQDANLPGTLAFRPNGEMTWDDAQNWIDLLNTLNAYGFNDWRLPTAYNHDGSGPDQGANVIGSEMGHLYYTELGNTSGTGGFTNNGPFLNIGRRYWSSPMIPDGWGGTGGSQDGAYYFLFNDTLYDSQHGNQSFLPATQEMQVWAVRDTPEPATMGLLGIGGIALLRRKKRG